jgi:hypothetical protein
MLMAEIDRCESVDGKTEGKAVSSAGASVGQGLGRRRASQEQLYRSRCVEG